MLGACCAVHGYGVLRPIEALDAFDDAAAPLWGQYGVAVPSWAGSDDIYLDPIPPTLQAPHVELVPRVHKLRTVERSPGDPRVDRPRVYVTFGTVLADQELVRTVLAGVGSIGVDVSATVGRLLRCGSHRRALRPHRRFDPLPTCVKSLKTSGTPQHASQLGDEIAAMPSPQHCVASREAQVAG
jgi:hypothetical protein